MYSMEESENPLMGAFEGGYSNNKLIETLHNGYDSPDWYGGQLGYGSSNTNRDLRHMELFRSKARGSLQKEAYNLYGRPSSITMQRESLYRGPEQMDASHNFRNHNAGTLEQFSKAKRMQNISKYDDFFN